MVFDKYFISKKLNRKGQLSIEFILILTIIILLIQTMILPMRNFTQHNLKDLTKTSYMENNIKIFENVFDKLQSVSEAKLDKEMYIPEDCNLFFDSDNNKISYFISYDKNMEYKNCKKNICRKDLNVGKYNISNKDKLVSKEKIKVTFKKEDNKITIKYTLQK